MPRVWGALAWLLLAMDYQSVLAAVTTSTKGGQLDCGNIPTYGRKERRVAICFFGLNRALSSTIESIRDQIFTVLDRACIQYDVYLHTYSMRVINNPRAAEMQATLGGWEEMLRLLKPVRYSVTEQGSFADRLNMSLYARHGEKSGFGFGTENLDDTKIALKNALCQWNSLLQVTHLWQTNRSQYHAVVYVRPDMWYLDPIDPIALMNAEPRVVYTPYWGRWGGLNDRFAFGSPDVATAYGRRLELAEKYAASKPLHSEHFLKWTMQTWHGFESRFTSMRAIRVRAGSVFEKRDNCLKRCRWEANRCCGFNVQSEVGIRGLDF